jgi:hypothetical protein
VWVWTVWADRVAEFVVKLRSSNVFGRNRMREDDLVLLPVRLKCAISIRCSVQINSAWGVNVIPPRVRSHTLWIARRADEPSLRRRVNMHLKIVVAVWIPLLKTFPEDFVGPP